MFFHQNEEVFRVKVTNGNIQGKCESFCCSKIKKILEFKEHIVQKKQGNRQTLHSSQIRKSKGVKG